jgi:hypothetical protein
MNKGGNAAAIGIAKGFGGLVSGVFGGIFDSVQRISGTLYAATQTLTGNERDIMSIEDQNEPTNILSGFGQGCVGFGEEIGKGFKGLCAEPCNQASIYGGKGFCKSFCKGLLGLIICPCAGIFKFITCVMAGCKNSCYVLTGRKRIPTTRFRYPRVIVEGEEKLWPYEENKAEARESIYQLDKIDTNNILFAEDFICPDVPTKLSTAILTDTHMYVLFNMNNIIFKLSLKNVNNTSLHYVSDRFYIAFQMNPNQNRIGFPIRNDFSNVALKLQDILYHMFNQSKIIQINDIKKDTSLIYGILTKDELIEKSSYANTINGGQSVYTHNTLLSKNLNKNKFNNFKKYDNESLKELNPHNNDYISLNAK